jgi:hypothetical protein
MHSFSLKSTQHVDSKVDGGRHAAPVAAHARAADSSAVLSAGGGPQAPAGSTVINIEPPAIGDDNNSACRSLRRQPCVHCISCDVT